MKSLQPPHSNYPRRPSGTRSKQHRHYQLSQRRKRQLVVMTKHTDDSASEDDGEKSLNFNVGVRGCVGHLCVDIPPSLLRLINRSKRTF